MERLRHFSLHIISLTLCAALAGAQPENIRLSDTLPVDVKVIRGAFSNGLHYFIRQNQKPEHRAELRLVVKAGSVLEDENQQGLAHFVEHMAFNGTKNFPKQDLVNFLESTGVRFGPELNAYTSFDETVYMLQVPTDTLSTLKRGFQVLEDWASAISFDDVEIDKERGVVGEEWRLGRGAYERVANKQYPILFYHSQYANRLPIGKKEVIDTASHPALKKFYKDWYRPDLMAVIAVGDFDVPMIEALIKHHFAGLKNPKKPRPRTEFTLSDHDNVLISVETDKEYPTASISVFFKRKDVAERTVGDYRHGLLSRLYDGILNDRFEEKITKPNPPYIYAYAGDQGFVGDKRAYVLGASVRENGFREGLTALLTEAERVAEHGFTATELERQKKTLLRSYESSFNERTKHESRSYVEEYTRHVLKHESIPGIEYEYELAKKYVDGATLAEVNALTKERITKNNRVITVAGPQKEGVQLPSKSDVETMLSDVLAAKTSAYEDAAVAQTLLTSLPSPGKIVSEKKIGSVGTVEWTLSNGAKVLAKATDFKNDQVLFGAFSPGGTTLIPENDYMSASTATQLVGVSGVGDLDMVALGKFLAGRVVNVSPYIGDLYEGFNGSCSPKDLDMLCQLVRAYVTVPRKDSVAFASTMTRIKAYLQNRSASPEAALSDTIQVTMSQYHHRARPVTPQLFDEVDMNKAFSFYRERFADLGDFTFVFVGAFSMDTLKTCVEKYIANLPTMRRMETWRDVGVRAPEGKIEKSVFKGIEPKASVRMMITAPLEYTTRNRFDLNTLMEVLQIKLREVVLEEKSGTYGISASASPVHYPVSQARISISFGCAPERVDELVQTVLQQLDSVKIAPMSELYVTKTREMQRRSLEVGLKMNETWLSMLQNYYQNGEDVGLFPQRMAWIDGITAADIQKTAQRYFDMKNFVKVVLYPEKKN
ncbi:MAG: insulinase family protein [Ignavibacteriales bacterium]|nr:insulinase family protein [Ignavibacteriales bacterium]